MGNQIVSHLSVPTPTPQIAKSLSPQDLREHRAGIASEVKVVLSAYFQPNEADDIRAAQLSWWCDELQDWTREQVVWGLREWNRKNPRVRPTPGDIVAILKRARGEAEAARAKEAAESVPQAPREPRVTAEQAQQILQDMGFPTVRRMPGCGKRSGL